MRNNISNFKKNIVTNISASLFVMGVCCMAPAYAGGAPAAGSLDLTFNINGIVTTDLGYVYDSASTVAIQSDGKIVVAGTKGIYVPYNPAQYVPGASDFALARYNTDGSLDSSFGTGGKVFTDLGSPVDGISDITIQSDGKIVVAGATAIMSCTGCYPLTRIAVVRYNANGSLDTSFGIKGIVITAISDRSNATSIALQTDGKIVVGGISSIDGPYPTSTGAILRYHSNGTLDSTFGVNGVSAINLSAHFDDLGNDFRAFNITDLALQTDGKIVAAGWATTVYLSVPGYNEAFVAVRYNANGTLDTSFNSTGVAITRLSTGSYTTDQADNVVIQSDGKIVLGGTAGVYHAARFALVRYNANGGLDATFGSGGKTTTALGIKGAYAGGLKLQSDGKIVLGGTAYEEVRVSGVVGTYPHFAIARYTTNGTLDNRFGSQGKVLTFMGPIGGYFSELAIQADKKILAVGGNIVPYDNYTGTDFAVLRYNP